MKRLKTSKLNLPGINIILTLTRIRVSLAVTFTAITGYLIYAGSFNLHLVSLGIGVFILAAGASALNQWQERDYDVKMERTRNRPLPSNKISIKQAFLISIYLITTGLTILYIFSGISCALLGLFNILWYNLLYTNLKRVTPFAVVPGSLTGAIPVLMGWCAAGGFMLDSRIIIVAFFLFIWQVPHFWFLLLKYGHEYEAAGFPSINKVVSPRILTRIIFLWILASAITTLMFPLFHVITSPSLYMLIFLLNIWLVILFARLTFNIRLSLNFNKAFNAINIFMLLFMILLSIQAVFHI
ncbi:MAG: protoheme IX farnesyltransferase [Bacteroidales bacterium]